MGYICPAGFFCTAGTTYEEACPVGTYQPSQGQDNCTQCPAGFMCLETNMTSPEPCKTGECWNTPLPNNLMFNPFPISPGFYMSAVQGFWKHCGEKEEMLVPSSFFFFPTVFSNLLENFCYFHQIWNCRLQTLSVWKILKFVIWERLILYQITTFLTGPNWNYLQRMK